MKHDVFVSFQDSKDITETCEISCYSQESRDILKMTYKPQERTSASASFFDFAILCVVYSSQTILVLMRVEFHFHDDVRGEHL